jgi:glycosyltransferase involved in cell wall biosynthesis
LVFDSHEFFTEAEGLSGRPIQRGVWLIIERLIMPGCRSVITVNDGIADALAERYPRAKFGRPFVVRNMPVQRAAAPATDRSLWARYGVDASRPIALMQGAFMDRDRGAKAAVQALDALPEITLVLIGAGQEFDWATEQQARFAGRLVCISKLPFDELVQLTASADVGLTLDLAIHGNFYMSLPNKLFDYIHAGLPVVATDLPEVRRVIVAHDVGQITPSTSPQDIADAIRSVLTTDRESWRRRCKVAAEQLHWDADSPHILTAVARAFD